MLQRHALTYLLGIRLIARNGLKTLIVRMADRFIFSTFRQYSKALNNEIQTEIPSLKLAFHLLKPCNVSQPFVIEIFHRDGIIYYIS